MPNSKLHEKALQWYWLNVLSKNHRLLSNSGKTIKVLFPGEWNFAPGPDFIGAIILLDGEKVEGDVEVHLRAGQWYAHRHHIDPAYNNVVLHLIFQNGPNIKLQNGISPETLVANAHANREQILAAYYIHTSGSPLPCAAYLQRANNDTIRNWQNKLLEERFSLQYKKWKSSLNSRLGDVQSIIIERLLFACSFGAYKSEYRMLFIRYNLTTILRARSDADKVLELILFPANILKASHGKANAKLLRNGSIHYSEKFKSKASIMWRSSQSRPANHPLIRLMQFASLLHNYDTLSSMLFSQSDYKELYSGYASILKIKFNDATNLLRETKIAQSAPKPSSSLIHNLIINFHLSYLAFNAISSKNGQGLEYIKGILGKMPFESNRHTRLFVLLKSGHRNTAYSSQALLHSVHNYCSKLKCLECYLAQQMIEGLEKIELYNFDQCVY